MAEDGRRYRRARCTGPGPCLGFTSGGPSRIEALAVGRTDQYALAREDVARPTEGRGHTGAQVAQRAELSYLQRRTRRPWRLQSSAAKTLHQTMARISWRGSHISSSLMRSRPLKP